MPVSQGGLNMHVAVGADNRGLAVRDDVVRLVQHLGHQIAQIQTPEGQVAEYPEIAALVAQQVRQGKAEQGILIARTGIGMCVVANKFSGIRAAVCQDEFMAEMSRRYLDANVLCLSAELLGKQLIESLVETWLKTPFEGGRHALRIDRISAIERGDHL
jgi:ribose 5-phosphate isomerase B